MKRTLRSASGRLRTLNLGTLLSRGGAAGAIYRDKSKSGNAIKIYHTPELCRDHAPKILSMIKRVPDLPPTDVDGKDFAQIAWPIEAALDESGQLIGFSMPLIDFKKSVELELLLQRASRNSENLPESQRFRLFVARNVSAIFAELHKVGHYVIDAKPINLRVYRETARAALLDCDGFSIAGDSGQRFPASHFTEGYICPEAASLSPGDLAVSQDNFALAVIIFQLLNNGIHPFQGRPKSANSFPQSDVQTRINMRSYPYGSEPDTNQTPSPLSLHQSFALSTVSLFDRAFKSASRPTASSWRDHLDSLIASAKDCGVNSEHLVFSGVCGQCELEKKLQRGRAQPTVTPIQVPFPKAASPQQGARPAPPPPPSPPLSPTYTPPPANTKSSGNGRIWWMVAAAVFLIWVFSKNDKPQRSPTQVASQSQGQSGSNQVRPPVAPSPLPSSPVLPPAAPPSAVRPAAAPQNSTFNPVGLAPVPTTTPANPSLSLPTPLALEPRIEPFPSSSDNVASRNANVRAEPNATSRVIGTLPQGTSLKVIGKVLGIDPPWLQIEHQSGLAYVAASLVQPRDQWIKSNSISGTASFTAVDKVQIQNRSIELAYLRSAPGVSIEPLERRLRSAWGGALECEPLIGNKYRCLTTGKIDVAEAAVFNGLALATADAPKQFRDAEEIARLGKRGFWFAQ